MKNKKKNSLNRKIFIASCSVVILGVMFLGSVAYLQHISSIGNQFDMGNTDIKVEEIFNTAKAQKTDVYLTNEGNTPVYMRAKVLFYYVDSEGNVLDIVPKEGTDYTLEQGTSDWIKKDDVYYYKTPVAPLSTDGATGKTTNLINRINDLIPNDNKYLVVDILGQSIQASPSFVVKETWHVTINEENGYIESISD